MLQHSKYRGGEERACSTFIIPTNCRSKLVCVGLMCIVADGMSHHFAHVNVSLGMLERVHAPFFRVQVVHCCMYAGSCSFIASNDLLGSLLM